MSEVLTAPITRPRAAFDATAAARAAVNLAGAQPYSLDGNYASIVCATTVKKRLPPYLPRILRLEGIDRQKVESFGLYGEALFYAQYMLLFRATRAKQMPALAEEGWALREAMMAAAWVLVLAGRFDVKAYDKVKEGSGYADLIGDLGALTEFFTGHPDLLGPGLTAAQVARATQIREAMQETLGTEEDLDLSQAELVTERHKLAVLLLASHAEIRRAVEFIRYYEGDAAKIVPSLYAPTKSRRASGAKDEGPDETGGDLAAIHDGLHAHPAETEPLDLENNPFAPDEET